MMSEKKKISNTQNCEDGPLFPSASLVPTGSNSSKDSSIDLRPAWLKINSFKKLQHEPVNQKSLESSAKPFSVDISPNKLYPKAIFREQTSLLPEKAFRIDKSSDKSNLAFEQLHYIPKYNHPMFKKTDKKKLKRYYKERKTLPKHHIVPKKQKENNLVLGSFIPLIESDEENSNDNFSYFTSSLDSFSASYLQESSLNSEQEQKEDLNNQVRYFDKQFVFDRIRAFNTYLATNKKDVEKWIEFVRFQTQIVNELGLSSEQLVEKQVSILNKALESNGSDYQLLMERLIVQQRVLDAFELNRQWKQLVFRYPNQVVIWENYFRFMITNVRFFELNKLSSLFKKCMEKLVQLQAGYMQSHELPENLEESMLRLLLLYSLVLEQSGYPEKACALWQAFCEFNLFAPDNLKQANLTDAVEHFEPFWESGVAKFGEQGALGWKTVVQRTGNVEVNLAEFRAQEAELSKMEDCVVAGSEESSDLKSVWLQLESLRMSYSWLPAKNVEECLDSERIVDFSVIRPALFRLSDSALMNLPVLCFLHFLGATQSHLEKNITMQELLDVELLTHHFDFNATFHLNNYSFKREKFAFIMRVFDQAIACLSNYEQMQDQLIRLKLEFLIQTDIPFDVANVRKDLKKLMALPCNRNNMPLWHLFCCFESRYTSFTSALKTYFKILDYLCTTGETNLQRNTVMISHLKRFSLFCLKLDPVDQTDFTFDATAASSEDLCKIITCLCSVIQGKKLDHINKSIINISVNELQYLKRIYSEDREVQTNIVILQALLIYFQNIEFAQFDQTSAVHLLNSHLDQLLLTRENEPVNPFLELFPDNQVDAHIQPYMLDTFQALIALQLMHCRFSLGSFAYAKQTLDKAMSIFPTNSNLGSLFVRLELQSALSLKVLRHSSKLNNLGCRANSLQWLFVIYYEFKRRERINQSHSTWERFKNGVEYKEANVYDVLYQCGGNTNRLRALFERSLIHCECVFLWRAYISFEFKLGELEKAKAVYYRALQRCPWSKNIYLDGISYFGSSTRSLFNDDLIASEARDEFQESLHLMKEKQIRIRTFFEEVKMLVENRLELQSFS